MKYLDIFLTFFVCNWLPQPSLAFHLFLFLRRDFNFRGNILSKYYFNDLCLLWHSSLISKDHYKILILTINKHKEVLKVGDKYAKIILLNPVGYLLVFNQWAKIRWYSARLNRIIVLLCNKLSVRNVLKVTILSLCSALQDFGPDSWKPTDIAGYLLRTDDG